MTTRTPGPDVSKALTPAVDEPASGAADGHDGSYAGRRGWRRRLLPREGVASARRIWTGYAAGITALAVLLVAVSGNAYWLNIIIMAYLFAGLATAWNIIGGFGGQLSLGHGVYFAVGAYSVAILFTRRGWSPWLGLLVALVLGLIVAVVTSYPAFRLRGPFFAMATLALNQVAVVLASYFASVTGGPRGVSITFTPGFSNLMFVEPWKYAALMLAFLALSLAVATAVSRRRLGYGLKAVREDQDAAAAAGLDVTGMKMRGMLLSAGLTTIGGGLFAVYVGYVDPDSVLSLPDVSVRIALLALLGGIGTLAGPVIGALLLLPAITVLQGSLDSGRPGEDLVIVGLLLVVIPVLLRRGIVGTAVSWARRLAAGGAR